MRLDTHPRTPPKPLINPKTGKLQCRSPGPYRQPLSTDRPYFPATGCELPALQCRPRSRRGDVAAGGAVQAAEALGDAASASSPMWLLCEDVRRKFRESASSTSVQFRVKSVVIRCALPLPRRAAYGAVPLGNGMATPGHFLLNRSFPVHHSRLTPAAPAALRYPWIGDEAARSRKKAAGA